jgi:hypothetical protein
LGALATESEDLFCNFDALDLVFGSDGGGGLELFSLEADAEGREWDEEDEESSLLSGLVKMEADEEEEKETFSGVMAREEVSDLLSREMVSDHLHLCGAKTHSPPHPLRRLGDQA